MTRDTRPTFTLLVRPEPGVRQQDLPRLLRVAVKRLLRAYGLRLVEIRGDVKGGSDDNAR